MQTASVALVVAEGALVVGRVAPRLTALAVAAIGLELAHILVAIGPHEHALARLQVVLELAREYHATLVVLPLGARL